MKVEVGKIGCKNIIFWTCIDQSHWLLPWCYCPVVQNVWCISWHVGVFGNEVLAVIFIQVVLCYCLWLSTKNIYLTHCVNYDVFETVSVSLLAGHCETRWRCRSGRYHGGIKQQWCWFEHGKAHCSSLCKNEKITCSSVCGLGSKVIYYCGYRSIFKQN